MSILSGKKVLIVDDEAMLREAVAYEFELIGCSVMQAESGDHAFEVLSGNVVDIVISDVRMPNGDGYDLLTRIKQKNRDVPIVVMLTGYSDYSEAELKKVGAAGVFHKPFQVESVIKALESVVLAV